MSQRVFIVIDGSNFYHRVKEIPRLKGSLLDFDYGRFTEWLRGKQPIAKKSYYTGVIRAKPNDKKGQSLRRDQQRLFARLRNNGWGIARGYILESGGNWHEKGVDVQIAVDLLVGAYENQYETAILVSSDSDLLPALMKIRSMGKRVEYVGFSHKPSHALITHSDVRRLLLEEDIERFLP